MLDGALEGLLLQGGGVAVLIQVHFMAKEGRFGVLHVVERCLALDHLQGGGVDGPAQGGAIADALVLWN